MLAIVVVKSGPGTGRRQSLSELQRVEVGRSGWADFAVAGDLRMAEKHFALVNQGQACRVIDLGTETGTFVNGQRITDQILRDGDVIAAGRTEFNICLKEHDNLRASSGFATQAASAKPLAIHRPTEIAKGHSPKLRFRSTIHAAGHPVLLAADPSTSPNQVVQAAAAKYNIFLLVNLAQMEATSIAEVRETVDLFDGLPASIRGQQCLHLFRAEDSILSSILSQGWGKDAVACLFSPGNFEAVRSAVGSSLGAFVRPSCLRRHLGMTGRIEKLLTGIAAVMVECEDQEGWEIHLHPSLGGQFLADASSWDSQKEHATLARSLR